MASLTASQLDCRRAHSLGSEEFRNTHFWLLIRVKNTLNVALTFCPNCPLATGSSALKYPLQLPGSLDGHSVKSTNHMKSNLFSTDVVVLLLILWQLCELSDKSTHSFQETFSQWGTKSKTATVKKQEIILNLGLQHQCTDRIMDYPVQLLAAIKSSWYWQKFSDQTQNDVTAGEGGCVLVGL